MNIQEKIRKDLKEAILKSDNNKKDLLRTVIGEFNRIDKNIDNEKALSIIKKMKYNADLINNDIESNILSEYLPKMASDEEIKVYIDKIFIENDYTMKDMGKIMKQIKNEFGSLADMKIASFLVKNKLK